MPAHRVAAVVPTWNEGESIGRVVAGLRDAGACCVFVVDAGSSDGTPAAAAAAGATVVEEDRRGYGRACLTGAETALASGHPLIAFLDGDGSCDPAELPNLVAAADRSGADLVLGCRDRVEAGALPWHARTGNRLVGVLLRIRTGKPVGDLPPFKLARAEALASLSLDEAGYGWTVQLVGRTLAHPAMRVVEIPSRFARRAGGTSKVSGQLVPSLRAAVAMLRQAWAATRGRGLLVVMAKAPRAGSSKTRMERDLGSAAAVEFWSACLGDTGDLVRRAAGRTGLDVAAMAPTVDDAELVRRLTGLPTIVQRDPGLGPALFEISALAVPFSIALSADVPNLPAEMIDRAANTLRSHPAVLGPGLDGGYYLVGLRHGVRGSVRRKAFLEAPMGTATVLSHTRSVLGDPPLLDPWPDVDTAEELRVLLKSLAGGSAGAPRVGAWAAGRHAVSDEQAV